eukprot:gene15592-17165_t
MLIDQRKNWQAYFHFAHRLRLENPALDAILACRTDGEKALIDGFQRNFWQDGATKYYGLVDCDTEREVSEKFANLKSSWDKLEQESSSKASCTFHEWFEEEKLADLITSMMKPVRIDAELGTPPTQYTKNGFESSNFVIKHHLQFDAKKPSEFINSFEEIITIQQKDEERAVFNKGPYIPAK